MSDVLSTLSGQYSSCSKEKQIQSLFQKSMWFGYKSLFQHESTEYDMCHEHCSYRWFAQDHQIDNADNTIWAYYSDLVGKNLRIFILMDGKQQNTLNEYLSCPCHFIMLKVFSFKRSGLHLFYVSSRARCTSRCRQRELVCFNQLSTKLSSTICNPEKQTF